jgi:hypothetical protein
MMRARSICRPCIHGRVRAHARRALGAELLHVPRPLPAHPRGWKFAERVYEIRYLDTAPLRARRPRSRECQETADGEQVFDEGKAATNGITTFPRNLGSRSGAICRTPRFGGVVRSCLTDSPHGDAAGLFAMSPSAALAPAAEGEDRGEGEKLSADDHA